MYTAFIPLILFSVALNASAQLFLRQGMPQVALVTSDGMFPLLASGLRVIFNPWVFAGLSCYAVSIVLWMYVLSKVQVSFAYPFLSVGYVIVVAAAYFWFREPVSIMKLAGVALICVGVVLVAKGG
ncbi:TPA: SMR family transporter [Stenotrophomonas maltophilia]|uniref:Transporter n=1 Tax=Stenotrophomonas maltophilia TaxID=40324 RepID=A0A2W6IG51_STEMA|nr:SMR family transporter [Stenotrophomonas maltophilia]MBB5530265.1 multidrug transporter EmrE-like cation transporter [Stenotrophomonas maltophilia]MDH0072092.1 SMR family transporter [Stenotrophomonas maltophilia]MDH0105062.1 SMR family transporter [Stenotrophomonas maltophilia]MDH0331050.1 SMR family transporter [Stenotrophomonas maltophilia]MDH0632387.1 SMR family transporter [Stenotrophomonas maltophilia]